MENEEISGSELKGRKPVDISDVLAELENISIQFDNFHKDMVRIGMIIIAVLVGIGVIHFW